MNVDVFVDAQGFFVNGTFFPRELAIISKENFIYFTFDLPSINLSKKNQKTVNFCTKKVHGIFWNSSKFDTYSIPVTLFKKILYNYCIKWKEDGLVGVRNSHLRHVLEMLKIPVFDMEQIEVKNDDILHCNLHNYNKTKCCINKVLNLYKTINN